MAGDPIHRVMRSNGQVRYVATSDVGRRPDGGRAQQQRTFATRREASQWLAEMRLERRDPLAVSQSPTLASYLQQWLAGRRSLRPTTARSYRDALAPVVRRLGDMRLSALSKRDVDGLVTWMLSAGGPRRNGVGPRTVVLTLNVLQRALQDAVRQGELRTNVVGLVERPRQSRAEMATWEPGEVQQFLDVAKQDRYHAAWLLSLMGLRRGEVLGLPWSDVALDAEPQITIRQARVLVTSSDIVVSPPKTARGRRSLPLDQVVRQALADLQHTQLQERDRAGAAYQDSGLVVVDEVGTPMRPDVYSSRFKRLVAQAGLRPIRLHDLRHTALTRMTLAGVPLPVVAAWAGHADPAFTLRVYAHSQPGALRQAGAALGLDPTDRSWT